MTAASDLCSTAHSRTLRTDCGYSCCDSDVTVANRVAGGTLRRNRFIDPAAIPGSAQCCAMSSSVCLSPVPGASGMLQARSGCAQRSNAPIDAASRRILRVSPCAFAGSNSADVNARMRSAGGFHPRFAWLNRLNLASATFKSCRRKRYHMPDVSTFSSTAGGGPVGGRRRFCCCVCGAVLRSGRLLMLGVVSGCCTTTPGLVAVAVSAAPPVSQW